MIDGLQEERFPQLFNHSALFFLFL
jgi:hypothetical protein